MFLRKTSAAGSAALRCKTLASLIVCLAAAACATPPGHQAFKRVMERQVGRQADDPDFYPVYYRLKQVDAKALPNGNTEEQYSAGRRGDCRLFFETTPGARRVVRWRYEGSERDCVIVPPQP
jgi:hypothetical protein